jgi:serine/threonine protein kinase
MSTKIGRFEVLSEIAKSERCSVYKASDPSNGQTVALKTLRLTDMPEEQAKALLERILAEAESTKSLNSQNVALLSGAGEIEGLFCAAMEYVQGNSIATMLARQEGFSIWDLLDISRQVCQGLDHAQAAGVVHYSLEPAKVMVQWDGTVKILGFGISSIGLLESGSPGKIPATLYYESPEQVQRGVLDERSNLFSWGSILYEMVTDRKAFEGADSETVRRKIVEEVPVAPVEINSKIHSAVSDLIMKSLSKAPSNRFQNGLELVNELEKCKQASTQPAKKTSAPAQGLGVTSKNLPPQNVAAAQAKFTGQPTVKQPPAAVQKPETKSPQQPVAVAKSAPKAVSAIAKSEPSGKNMPAPDKVARAAAGIGVTAASSSTPKMPKLDPSAQFITSCVKASVEALESQEKESQISAAAVAAEPAVESPTFAVDPTMAGEAPGTKKPVSFSDLDELPPLKEVFLPATKPAVSPEENIPEAAPGVFLARSQPEKPKLHPREVAKKALKEVKGVPPKLMVYSVSGAVALVLFITLALAYHIHSQNADDEGNPASVARSSSATTQAQATRPAPAHAATAPRVITQVEAEPTVPQPEPVVRPRYKNRKTAAPVPAKVALVPGQLTVDSTPEGAQVQIDGRSDPGWVTPYNLAGLAPGAHRVSVVKNGYTAETRSVDVTSGSKSFLVIRLAQIAATVSLNSQPAGASVFIDGKDSGRTTPTQITMDKGTHTFLVRKQGYLDETTTADLQPGQTFHFVPALRVLGNVDDIKTVGKFKKFFKGGGDGTADMGTVSIKTQPKGAQVSVNRRMLDKASPVEFMLNPGNYIVDITLSGYKPIHRVINVDKHGKVAIDEAMERE